MRKLLLFGLVASVLNVLVVWVLTHFLIIVLGAATWGIWSFAKERRNG
jgi:hypothetical protein